MALHLVVTDSGVGGLSACAAIERALRASHRGEAARVTYVNAWPSEDGGYNDMPDIRTEAEVFDRALSAMAALQPDQIVIACNTLSIVYEHTAYRARRGGLHTPNLTPLVIGIVDAGVDLFVEALGAEPDSRIALFGTKTTIESGIHRERLIAKGVSPDRIIPVGCHGLARSIENEMDGPATLALIEECMARAATTVRPGRAGRLFLGVCCTHYTYVRGEMRAAFERHTGQPVEVVDPTDRLVASVVGARNHPMGTSRSAPMVSVVSKVSMPEEKRRLIAERIVAVSPATAQAVLAYTHVPNLF